MQICYIDESGCLGALRGPTSPVQPALVLTGVFVDRSQLPELTRAFLDLKAKRFPGLMPVGRPHLDKILSEVKGNDLRKSAAAHRRREWRHAIGFLDELVRLLRMYDVRLVSRVWIKGVGQPFNGNAAYAYSIQQICESFQNYLPQVNDYGMVIADNRVPSQNRNVSHSIFTQKFKTSGDNYGRILEMPTFGDSQNHAGLQICDLVCSAVIQPIAVFTYCTGHVQSVHVRGGYSRINARFRSPVRDLQHRYLDGGRWRGGITVNDAIAQRSARDFFRS